VDSLGIPAVAVGQTYYLVDQRYGEEEQTDAQDDERNIQQHHYRPR
jgi:hypothetical protein